MGANQPGGAGSKVPIQITFLGNTASEETETAVRKRVRLLERFSGNIQKCQVWVEARGSNRLYGVRIRLSVPEEELAIESQAGEEDIHVAIRNTFDAARRKLYDYARRHRGEIPSHPRPSAGNPRAAAGEESAEGA